MAPTAAATVTTAMVSRQIPRWDHLLGKEHGLKGLNGPNESAPGEAKGSVGMKLGEVLLVLFCFGLVGVC